MSEGAIMRVEPFIYFCIKVYIGTQGEDLSTKKSTLNTTAPFVPPPPQRERERVRVAYATDRS